MLKSEFITKVSEKTGLSKKDVVAAIDAYNETVVESLQSGASVQLKGFGTFSVSARKARIGRNPHTGEPLNIPASICPTFKFSQSVKDLLNSKK